MISTKKILDDSFLIAIKFGCKETSASFYNPINGKKFLLEILPGCRIVESSIAIVNMDGKNVALFGDSANQQYTCAEYYQRYFEKPLSEMDELEIYLMTEFLKGVYISILDRHPDYKTRKHYVVLIPPCESSLFKVESNAYLEIGKNAGLPIISVQENYTSLLKGSLLQPDSYMCNNVKDVIYIDFREDRLKFSYCDSLNDILSPSKFGIYSGYADIVNDIIASYYRTTESEAANSFFKLYGWNEDSNCFRLFRECLLRSIVQFYQNYKHPHSRLDVIIDYGFLTYGASTDIDGFDGYTCLKDTGSLRVYQDKFRQQCAEFKREIGNKNPSVIFLIGDYGFNQNPFWDIIQQVFDKSTIFKSDSQNKVILEGALSLSMNGYNPLTSSSLNDYIKVWNIKN